MVTSTALPLLFGPFTLHVEERRLERDGLAVSLSPKALDVLICLVAARGRVVSKDELMAAVWANTFVEEANLTQTIFVLRRALGEEHPYVETVPRRGYRFAGAVSQAAPEKQDDVAAPAAEAVPAPAPRHTPAWRSPAAIVTAALAIAIAGAATWLVPSRRQPFAEPVITQATTTRDASAAAISPDGRFLAYTSSAGDGSALHLRQLATGTSLEIARNESDRIRALAFSADGAHVFFTMASGSAHRVATIGGAPTRVLDGVASSVVPSPDGTQLAFVGWWPGTGERALVVASTTGGGQQRVLTRRDPDVIVYDSLAWSPDGRRLAALTNESFGGNRAELVEIDLSQPERVQVIGKLPWNAGSVAWLPGDRGFLVAAGQIWHVRRGAEPRRVTNDTAHYRQVTVTADGRTAAAVQGLTTAHVVKAPWPGVSPEARLLTEGAPNNGIAFLPDGRMIYLSYASGDPDLWITGEGRRGPQQLTGAPGRDIHPSVPRDGRFIAFATTRDGGSAIWRMNPDGSGQRRLSGTGAQYGTAVSPDGSTVAYHRADETKSWLVWAVPSDGGEPRRLTTEPATFPAYSPDGARIACNYLVDGVWKIAILAAAGGPPERIIEAPGPPTRRIGWAPDGDELVVASGGRLEAISLATGTRRLLADAGSEQILAFAWTASGREIAWVRAAAPDDVVLLRDVR